MYNEFYLLPERAFRKIGRKLQSLEGGKGSAPPPPDYQGAAQATAQGNLDAARAAATANRVNQYTPYGSLVYNIVGQDPHGNDIWSATQSLSPDQQALLNQQNKLSLGLSDVGNQGLSYVQNMMNSPFSTSNLASMPIGAGQSIQDAMMSRLQPLTDQENNQFAQQMANQGIAPGTEAYGNARRILDQQQNDRYNQAVVQGMNTDLAARQQGFQENAYMRNEPINTLNAVRSGSQVTGPSFVGVPQQSTTAGADYSSAAGQGYNAALGNYNAQVAQSNANTQAAAGLAGAGLAAYMGGAAMMF